MKRKVMTFIEGTCAAAMWLSMSAMDSEDVTIPAVVMVVSAMGLLVTCKIEQKNSTPADQSQSAIRTKYQGYFYP